MEEIQPEPKRYMKFLGSPRKYFWGFVVILTILTIYSYISLKYNLWPFQVEPIIQRNY